MKVMLSVVIGAPVEGVWQAVRRFDGVVAWNPGVVVASLESGAPSDIGAVLRLVFVGSSVFRQTLLAHTDIERCYTYDILESPPAFANYIARRPLVEITEGNMTPGIWEGEFDCDPVDAATLEQVLGDGIYRDAQLALNQFLQESWQRPTPSRRGRSSAP